MEKKAISDQDDPKKTYLILMKPRNQLKGLNSIVIHDKNNKKHTFALQNEKEFFQVENINRNIKNIYSALENTQPQQNPFIQDISNENKTNQEIDNSNIKINPKSQSKLDIINNMQPQNIISFKKQQNNQISPNKDKGIEKDQENFQLEKAFTIKSKKKSILDFLEKITDNNEIKLKEKSEFSALSRKETIRNKFENMNSERNSTTQPKLRDSLKNSVNCFICDQYSMTLQTVHLNECGHSYCFKCGKSFHEEKVEQGETRMKCPNFKCETLIELEVVKSLISDVHFEKLFNQIQIKKKLSENNQECADSLRIEFDKKKIKQEHFKNYSQKHVLDITHQDSFLDYSRLKEHFCIKCFEPALFGKIGRNFIRCLNCLHLICKYCMKDLTIDHFDIRSNSYCKIFFRKKEIVKIEKKCKFLIKIITSIIMYVVAYIFLIFGVFTIVNNYITEFICFNGKNCYIMKVVLYFFIWIIATILIVLLLWVCLPFFPILVAIIN